MKPASFRYYAPQHAAEAVALLGEHAPNDGHILAGGQSLVPMMTLRLARPGALIDINNIPEFAEITNRSDSLSIGPCVRHAAFHEPVVDGVLGALLSEIVNHIAHYPIRVRGTFCGSIAHGDPSSEWCLVAAALDAQIQARSVRGERIINARDYFRGAMMTALEAEELIEAVQLPMLAPDSVFGFYEFSRRAGDYAMAAALAVYRIEEGRMRDVRLALGGAEDYPRRISEAEAVLEGANPGADVFQRAAHAASQSIDPIVDAQSSGEFRRDLVRTICERALARMVQHDG
jgi:carbon-monoxide dehydrogenase medium subunit